MYQYYEWYAYDRVWYYRLRTLFTVLEVLMHTVLN
eukprot:COSAG02_NODE_2557_length_8529_cov_7.615658_4_plen_35_part_00